jgi:hypothetical protein
MHLLAFATSDFRQLMSSFRGLLIYHPLYDGYIPLIIDPIDQSNLGSQVTYRQLPRT